MTRTRQELEAEAQAGLAALQSGQYKAARDHLQRVVREGPIAPQLWLYLAQACMEIGDADAAHKALDQVLAAEPRGLYPLLMKGDLLDAAGDDRGALAFYRRALAAAAGVDTLSPDLQQRLERARATSDEAERRFEAHLDACLAEAGIRERPPRFARSLAIAAGKQEIYLQQPTTFYYPELPQTPWYDPVAFDWTEAFESRVAEIRAEIEPLLAEGSGLVPYVEAEPNRPTRGHSLLGDDNWSALYLWKNGARVEEVAARCPVTMGLLELPPIPRIDGRSPMALISVLKPGTHIPPHTGMLNTRLICHIPLIVPDGCRLRVGPETREVQAGKAMIFDDSIEHEAWNDGPATRAVLLFEIWRPELTEEERVALTAMYEAIGAYPSAA